MERIKSVDATIQSIYSKISRPFRTAFMAAVIFAIIAHLYMFMNKLPNYDDMGLNGFGATFRLGRWFLWVSASNSNILFASKAGKTCQSQKVLRMSPKENTTVGS